MPKVSSISGAASSTLGEPLLVPAAAAAPLRAKRLELLDNAKAVLISSVVLYHSAVVYSTADRPEVHMRSSLATLLTGFPMRALALAHSHCATPLCLQHAIPFISGLLALMKLVVMPCFCMISGHLSPATIEDRHARGLVKVLATYLIFQGLYFAMKVVAFTLAGFGVQKLPIELFNPPQQVVTWFLLALIIWRASLPTMLRTRVPMLISLLLAHGALFADLGVNHQNVLSFWPFFVGGALVPRDAWAQLNRPAVRRPLAASFVTCALSLALFSAYGGQHFHDAFYQLTRTYACFNGSPPDPSGVKLSECSSMRELGRRATFYVASLPLMAGFLCLMPRHSGWLTTPGHLSMYVYLLHPLLLFNPWVLKTTFDALSAHYGREVTVWSPATDGSVFLLLVPASLLACAALSTPWARVLLWPLVEPPIDWLLFGVGPPPTAGAPGAANGARLPRDVSFVV